MNVSFPSGMTCPTCHPADINMKLHSLIPFSKSLKKTLWVSYSFIIVVMILPTVYFSIVSSQHTHQYDTIITNVSRANRLNQIVKIDISNEIWDIVAGKKAFSSGRQYEIIKNINDTITQMMETTLDENNRQVLVVSARTLRTLERYVDQLGTQILQNASVADNEKVLEDIRGVCSLLYDILQDFIVSEIESAAITNEHIKTANRNAMTFLIIIIITVSVFALYAFIFILNAIRRPIRDMQDLSTRIAQGDLEARTELAPIEELEGLSDNLNQMAGKIQDLIDQNTLEQKNLQKAEMKTLQAQITPHFLYNTFDTIIWLAESEEYEKVIEITRAFSDYFRISLSKGHEWITFENEFQHVQNYLKIQKIRYRDILDYTLDFDDSLKSSRVLKLIFQPLVENAIYHGIKNKRGKGLISVSAHRIEKNGQYYAECCVEDNGIGFTPERLQQVLLELHKTGDNETLTATYGLYNVNKRLTLYYDSTVKLYIESELRKGSKVLFTIPLKEI